MKKKFFIAITVCLILCGASFYKLYQSVLVYEEYLTCEQSFDQLNEKYSNLPYEIGQLKIQLGIATREAEVFIRGESD